MVTTDVREKQSMGTSRGSFLSWRLTHSGLYWLKDECFLCFHVGPRRRVVLNTLQGSGVHRGEDTVHTINTPALSWITAMSDWCLSSRAPAQKGQLLRPEVSIKVSVMKHSQQTGVLLSLRFGSTGRISWTKKGTKGSKFEAITQLRWLTSLTVSLRSNNPPAAARRTSKLCYQ